jgi:cysteine synthase A
VRPLARSIVDVVGGTPLLEASRLVEAVGAQGRLLVKLEYLNPGLSKKDRVAKAMVEQARDDGTLLPGQPVVELTSGNTGTGLAMVCSALGHPFTAVMSCGNTPERAQMMRALGADVELVAQAGGSAPGQVSGADLALVEARVEELTRQLGAFRADQFSLASSALAHERGTGPELWEQSGQAVQVFADLVGSSGSFTGVSRFLRSVDPATRCYVVEPASAAVLAGHAVGDGRHKLQGGGYARADLPLLDRELVSGYLEVTDEEATETARLAARLEGVLGGFSTGANLAAALHLLRGPEQGSVVAVLACDSGLKYLSTELYA